MNFAVTGATGLIGTALTKHLTASGHRVLRLVRTPSIDTDTALWDPAAGTIDAASLEGIHGVVHLAGAGIGDKRWTPQRKAEILDSRVEGTSLLARTLAGLDHRPKRFLSASAIGIYGNRGDEELTEDSPTAADRQSGNPDFAAQVCTAWEQAAEPALVAGIPTTFLRTGLVMSVLGGVLAKQLPAFRMGLGGRLGTGRQWQSWISIDDEVGAITHLLTAEEPPTGPVNLTSPQPVTQQDFAHTLGRALRRPVTVTPMIGPRLLFGRELADTLLLGSQRVLPNRLTASGYTFVHPELGEALRALLGINEN